MLTPGRFVMYPGLHFERSRLIRCDCHDAAQVRSNFGASFSLNPIHTCFVQLKCNLMRLTFEMALLICCTFFIGNVLADDKPRVASINLCTDRLVLALADEAQIVSLSYVAADPNSMIHTATENIDLNHGRLEELLTLDVDYVLASEFDDVKLLRRLSDYGKNVRQFAAARTIDQSKINIRLMSELLEQPERGAVMVDNIDGINQLDKISATPRTLLLGANNYISGKNTLASNVIELMGYRNIAHEVNITDYGRISMEQIVELNPEVIIVSKYSDDYSRAQSVLQHPILREIGRDVTVIRVPTREWICGDEALIQASKRLLPKRY